jgi:DNA-binding CsgD family transcriptional regulator
MVLMVAWAITATPSLRLGSSTPRTSGTCRVTSVTITDQHSNGPVSLPGQTLIKGPHIVSAMVTVLQPGESDRTMNRLTRREQDIALLVHAGLTNKAIADRLGLTVPSVKRHLQNTFRKLRISNRTLLAIFVQQSRKLVLSAGPNTSIGD